MDFLRVQDTLEEYLRLASFPVGVKMLRSIDEVSPKAKRPARDFGKRMATCQANTLARKYGWVMAVGKDGQACPIGAIVLGYREPVEYYTAGNLAHGMYCETLEAGARAEKAVGRFGTTERGLTPILTILP